MYMNSYVYTKAFLYVGKLFKLVDYSMNTKATKKSLATYSFDVHMINLDCTIISLVPRPSHVFQHFSCETLKNMGRPGTRRTLINVGRPGYKATSSSHEHKYV